MRAKNIITGIFVLLLLIAAVIFIYQVQSAEYSGNTATDKKENDSSGSTGVNMDDPFVFERTKELSLFSIQGQLYVNDGSLKKADMQGRTLTEDSSIDKLLYSDNKMCLYLKGDAIYYVKGNEPAKEIINGVQNFELRNGFIIATTQKETLVYILDSEQKKVLFEIKEDSNISLPQIIVFAEGNYYAIYDQQASKTNIYKVGSPEPHKTINEEAISAHIKNDVLLVKKAEQDGKKKIDTYDVNDDQFYSYDVLTKEKEFIFRDPRYDHLGRIRYLTSRDGVLYLNFIDLKKSTRGSIELKEEEKFISDERVGTYDVISFNDGFFYASDSENFHYYETSFSKISIWEDTIFLTKANELKVIKNKEVTTYSLKGEVENALAIGDTFYYTYSTHEAKYLDAVEVSKQ